MGRLVLHHLREGYSAEELNLLPEDPEPDEEMFWTTSETPVWEELESIPQIAEVLQSLTEPGQTFTFQGEEPINKYAQGARLDDGNFMLELAVVDDGAYNMRIAYGPDADQMTSHPDDDVERYGPQSRTLAQTYEVLAGWVSGRRLPTGNGGSIHIYG
ncbi:hypothetical protein AFL94_04840 [Arthrobacter sp. LS16]|nr:hypothetical protein AFL94_04840 [Arthrobacter sp. LS16]